MKLLIVDDQKAVVDGLLKKIAWDEIGIQEAVGAYSALEARQILLAERIDVMLCDIEMPQESGLSLVTWMRRQDMQTKCIFLTAHAEFSYARQSVSLGAFDYVVQPAPYTQIRDAVERAVKELQSEQHQGHLQKYSQVANWKTKREAAVALRGYLLNGEMGALQDLIDRGELPGLQQQACLIRVQIKRWFSMEKWTDDMFALMMLDSAADEVFDADRERFVVLLMDRDRFDILLWNTRGERVGQQLNQQLGFFYNVCRQQLQCKIWVDSSVAAEMRQLPGLYQDQEFVTQPEQPQPEEPAQPPSVSTQWQELLLSGKTEELKKAVRAELRHKRTQNSEELCIAQTWQELMDAVEAAAGGSDLFWRKILVDTESFDIYRNAGKTEEDLMAMLALIQQRFSVRDRDHDIVNTIVSYLDSHLDKEIHRSDLAELVYLNPDHLNRLFKKQTGKTLKEFVSEYKMNEARKMLQITNLPVGIIAAKVGYDSFSHFSAAYKKVIGQSPLESRNAYRAEKEEP